MPLEIGAFLLADEAASAAAADALSTAAFADVGMGSATSLMSSGISGEALSGLMGGAPGAGGVASLPGALTSALPNIQAVNPEIASQVMNAANAGQIPVAGTQLGAGQIGAGMAPPVAPTAPGISTLGAGQIGTIPEAASSTMTPAQEAYLRASSASASPGITQGTVPLQTPVPPVGSPISMAQMAGNIPPPDTTFANVDLANAADQSFKEMPIGSGGFPNPLKSIYDIYKDQDPLTKGVMKYGGIGLGALGAMRTLGKPTSAYSPPGYSGPLSKFRYDPGTYTPYSYRPYVAGGPVEEMSRENAIGANTGYPQADINQGAYATPWQTPVSRNVVTGPSDANVDQMTGDERMAGGGIASLGSYSDGGRLLRGPGDGMSDGIPATISGKQPARLADGEFVVPADVVSGLGNGSTDAGAKHLYSMMDKVRQARTGTKKQGKQINPRKYVPA